MIVIGPLLCAVGLTMEVAVHNVPGIVFLRLLLRHLTGDHGEGVMSQLRDCPGCGAPAGTPPAAPCYRHGTRHTVADNEPWRRWRPEPDDPELPPQPATEYRPEDFA